MGPVPLHCSCTHKPTTSIFRFCRYITGGAKLACVCVRAHAFAWTCSRLCTHQKTRCWPPGACVSLGLKRKWLVTKATPTSTRTHTHTHADFICPLSLLASLHIQLFLCLAHIVLLSLSLPSVFFIISSILPFSSASFSVFLSLYLFSLHVKLKLKTTLNKKLPLTLFFPQLSEQQLLQLWVFQKKKIHVHVVLLALDRYKLNICDNFCMLKVLLAVVQAPPPYHIVSAKNETTVDWFLTDRFSICVLLSQNTWVRIIMLPPLIK